jgi:hypothetical protein
MRAFHLCFAGETSVIAELIDRVAGEKLPGWYADVVALIRAGLGRIAARDESLLLECFDTRFKDQVSAYNFRLYRRLRIRVANARGQRFKKVMLAMNLG